jgi:prevent-host-death family protein
MLINIAEAKANLSKLISLAEQGEAITIARNNKPLVDLVAHQASKERQLGGYAGQVTIADDFDAQDKSINNLFTGQDV